MSRATTTLEHGVRPRVVGRYLGQLLIAFAGLTAVPALVAAAAGELHLALACGVVAVAAALVGLLLARAPSPDSLQQNEGLVIVAGIFVLAAASMTWPLTSAGLAPGDAFFEAVSAVTTTGLTTLPTLADTPESFRFLRSFMQWYGGFGIVALVLALTPSSGAAAVRLAEASGRRPDEDLAGSTRARVRRFVVVYLALTVAGWFLLLVSGAGFGSGLHHVLSAVSTGGFSDFDGSLAGFDTPFSPAAALLVASCGAISFGVYSRARQDGPLAIVKDRDVQALLLAALLVSLVLTAIFWLLEGRSLSSAAGHGLALGVSAQTSTGFSTTPVAEMSDGAKLVIIAAMFVGGDIGSTAGGFKIVRMLVLMRIGFLAIQRLPLPPHAVLRPTLHDKPLESEDVQSVIQLFLCFWLFNAGSWLVFVLAGYAPLDALFDVVSATGTVGLSTGVVGPELPAPLKLLLCVNMLAGRLEVLALVALLDPRSWIGKRRTP